ncbi:MAG: ribosome biogenesis GTPase Der [Candidatus Latescibacterota bacterium]
MTHEVRTQPPPAVHRVGRLRPVVAIVGRPNVGKSTLLNRVVQARRAITDDQPGVTRDRLYVEAEWDGVRFTLVDTGGYVAGSTDVLVAAVRTQAVAAVAEADVVMLLCDAHTGVTDLDLEVAELVRRAGKPALVAVNKVDSADLEGEVAAFHRLGLGEPVPVSAATGRRSGDLLDRLLETCGQVDPGPQAEMGEALHLALAGRPNVGKSTLMNRLAGEQISVVHAEPGTTRDTTSVRFAYGGRDFVLMDTAGLRRRARVESPVEYYSTRRALDSIEHADVVLVLVDAVEGCTVQDARVIHQAIDAGCGLIVAANKWDCVDAQASSAQRFAQDLHARFPFLGDYPLLFISALTGRGVHRCLEWAARVHEERSRRIPTSRLNAFFAQMAKSRPPLGGTRELRLLYATQYGIRPPAFAVFVNHTEALSEGYRRFVERQLRQEFGFEGSPVRLSWRRRRTG